MPAKIKILLLASDPYADGAALRIDLEARTIRRALERSRYGNLFELVSEWAVTVNELQHVLLTHEPTIVHFAGHGDRDKGILLTNIFGDEHAVDRETLADLFGVLQRFVHVVVLNACETLHIAETLQEVVDYSIGMSKPIIDAAATAFADGFYSALAQGSTMDEAFRLGRIQIRLVKLNEWRTPHLLVRDGVDPNGRLFASPEREPPTPPWVEALEIVQQLHGPERIAAYASLRPHVDGGDPEANTAIRTFLLEELARAGTQIFAALEELAKWLPAREKGLRCTPSDLLALEILPNYAVTTIEEREVAEEFAGEYPLLAMRRDTLQRNASLLIGWLFHPAMPAIYATGDRGAKTTRAGLIATWATILGTMRPQSDGAATPDEVLTALVDEIRKQTSGAGGVDTRAALTAYWEEMKADHARLAKLRAWSERARRRDDLRRRDSLQTLLDRFRNLSSPASA